MENQRYAYLADGTRIPHAALAPIVQVMRSITGKWKLEILFAMTQGRCRFGELRRAVPGATQHMLTTQLRELEADGFITRTAYGEIPLRVEYDLTDATRALKPVFDALMIWARAHAPALVARRPDEN